MLYFDAVQRHERRERAARLTDVNQAFNGGDDANAYLRKLQQD